MTSCDDVRLSLGAYALGALDPAEEQSVRDHLESCPECAAVADELVETAGLLSLVGPADLEAPPRPGADLLPRTLRQLVNERRRRRWIPALAAAAAAVVVIAAGAVFDTVRPAGDPAATPAATSSPTPDAVLLAADQSTGVSMRLESTARPWGTALHLELAGVPGGLSCSLVAVARDGAREVAATWTVPAGGYGGPDSAGLVVDGAVGFPPGEVAAYEIVTSDGRTLLAATPR